MRILIVSGMFPPIQTGTSFYTKNLALTLKEAGHHLVVVTVKRKEILKRFKFPFKVVRIPSFQIPLKNYFKHFSLCSLFLKNYSNISTICEKEKIEAIILVNQYLDIVFPTIYSSLKNKIPMFISIGTQLQSTNFYKNKILNIFDRFVCGNLIYPFSKKIICWDKEIERYINNVQKKRFSKKTVIIPFGIDGNVDEILKHKHVYKLHYQILGIGSIIGHRNFVFNIKVFRKILKKMPNMKLKIIGHIYDKRVVELVNKLKLNKNVIFTGELNHEIVLKELGSSDIHWMMLDGEYKGLGTANLEAMFMGVPIVSNVPNNLFGKDLLKDMENCILVKDHTINKTSKKILEVLNNFGVRKKIGINGRCFCKKNMSWNKIGKQFKEMINN